MSTYTQFLYQLVFGSKDHLPFISSEKEASNALICRERSLFHNFPGWQVGYSGFTYHISSKNSLINYVRNQAQHHKTISYKDELIELLIEHGVDYKDEYLFI